MTLQSDGGNPTKGTLRRFDEPTVTGRLSPETVRTLYEAHGPELLEFLAGVLRDVNVAQDILQITFRRVLEVGHTASNETIKSWIFKLALQEALLFRRQVLRQDRKLKKYASVLEKDRLPHSFDGELSNEDEAAKARKLISQLPVDQQQVVRLRLIGDKSFAMIAEELGVPLGTVLSRMRLGLEKLRKWFNGIDAIAPRKTNRGL